MDDRLCHLLRPRADATECGVPRIMAIASCLYVESVTDAEITCWDCDRIIAAGGKGSASGLDEEA